MVALIAFDNFESFEELQHSIIWLIRNFYDRDEEDTYHYMIQNIGPRRICPLANHKTDNGKHYGCHIGKINFWTFNAEEHYSLDCDKKWNNIQLLKGWLLNALKRLSDRNILKYKKYTSSKMIVGLPQEGLTIDNISNPIICAELQTQKGIRLLSQARCNGRLYGKFNALCVKEIAMYRNCEWVIPYLNHFKRDNFGETIMYVGEFTPDITENKLKKLIEKRDAYIIQTKLNLPFPKNLADKSIYVRNFIEEHPNLIKNSYPTMTHIEVVEYDKIFEIIDYNTVRIKYLVTKGRVVKKLVYIKELGGILPIEIQKEKY